MKPQNNSKIKLKKFPIIIIVLCILLLFVTFCFVKFAPKRGGFPGGRRPGGTKDAEMTVRTSIAEVQTLHDYVDTNGEIECESSVDCFPDIGGKIAKVFVALGDRVKKGDVLATVDPSEPGLYYENSSVLSPISGTVTSTPKDIGTTVTTSSSITTVGDVSNLQIRSKVPERYVAFLTPGLKAQIVLEAYPEETFGATVKKVSPVLDPESRTKEILLFFDEADNRINAGMFAKLTLFTVDYTDEVVVPSNAAVEKNGKKYCFVLSDDGHTVEQREVRLGKTVDYSTQILSGVKPGERIVVEGMTTLSDGVPVKDISLGKMQEREQVGQNALEGDAKGGPEKQGRKEMGPGGDRK